jgi:hypothetical protein
MPRGRPHKQAEVTAPEGQPAERKAQATVNKTEAIRALLERCARDSRDTAPKALVEELRRLYPSERWTLAYVSSIKSKLKKRRPPPPPGAAPPVTTGEEAPAIDPVALVLAVKALAKRAGGLDRLKQLIEALQGGD